jgi:serpin B
VLLSTLSASAKKKGYELSVANRLWGQKGEGFLRPFLGVMKRYYGAGFREVDFKKDAEGAAKQINAWAEKETRGKIQGVIPTGFLDSLTRLVLTSAVYFRAPWGKPFEQRWTTPEGFMVTPVRRVQVPMMHQMETFSCFEDDELQVLEMPYKGGQLSMVILLPRKVEGLDALEEAFSKGAADEWLRTLRPLEVEVAMPRFTMTVESRMDEALKSLGMTDAFALPAADFSAMNGQGDLFLGAVLHKAFVDVNEEGTEAAAVTAVPAPAAAVAGTRFRADHPFLFLIRDRRTGCILFLGRLTNPGT